MGQEYIAQVNSTLSLKNDYATDAATAANAYSALIAATEPYLEVSILIENNDAIASFKDAAGAWGEDVILAIGSHNIDLECYGVKVKNRTAGANSVYQVFGLQNV